MKEMEKELWDYIDGVCTLQEKKAIEDRITQDPAVAGLYREMLVFNAGLAGLEPDEPSMGFTRKVMDAVRDDKRPAPVAIDKRLVIGISAFFGTVFLACFCVLLYSVNGGEEPVMLPVDLSVPADVYTTVFSTKYLVVFYLVDVVLALYVLDAFLRKRLLSKKL